MCRLIAYLGQKKLLADVLIKPKDSLLKQSISAKESDVHINGDGFGIGWYDLKINRRPAQFLSVLPAWNDVNFFHLSNNITSECFFAHVRAASIGGVNMLNCHPFVHDNLMLMHNGAIHDFIKIKRPLRRMLDDDVYNWLKGQTDTEHMFALFLHLAKGKDLSKIGTIAKLLLKTFSTIEELLRQNFASGPSFYNVCITDGIKIVATRFCTDPQIQPESLHYLKGRYFWSKKEFKQKRHSNFQKGVMIASEILTDFKFPWKTIPANHMIMVDSDLETDIIPIKL